MLSLVRCLPVAIRARSRCQDRRHKAPPLPEHELGRTSCTIVGRKQIV